jgi:hypothetical protein
VTTATATAGETVVIRLTPHERAMLRSEIDIHFGTMTGGLDWLEEDREVIGWALPVLDLIGWDDGRDPGINVIDVVVPREPFARFMARAHQRAVEYVEDNEARIERVRSGDPGWRAEGTTVEEGVALEEAALRLARLELGLVQAILAQVEA